MADRYNGQRLARDWNGKRVTLTREVATSHAVYPKGTAGVITAQSSRGLDFTGTACSCCGVMPRVTHLGYFDVTLAEVQS